MTALDRQVALRAAEGWLLLKSGDASATEAAHWQRWRAADPAHEIAWQRAERIGCQFDLLPRALAVPVLARPVRADRRAAIRTLAVLLTAAPAGWLAWHETPVDEWMAEHRTATGERREIRLPDGSRIQLNTGTSLDVAFDSQRRLLRLRGGEVFIETAPDPEPAHRPFVVETGHGVVRALGTRFVVRTERACSRVSVMEHAVEIRAAHRPDKATRLEAGQQARFDTEAVGMVEAAEPYTDAWTRGVLYVRDKPLGRFIAELSRYRPGVLRCDPAVAGLRVSGAFQLNDTTPVLESLPRALPVQLRYRSRYWVTVEAPDAPDAPDA